MTHSKYWVRVSEITPLVKVGQRVTVIGIVCTANIETRTRNFHNQPRTIELFSSDNKPLSNQKMCCDIVAFNQGANTKETKRFVTKDDGGFSFYINTKGYEPHQSAYHLKFYGEDENPNDVLVSSDLFYVMGASEYDSLGKFLKPVAKFFSALEKTKKLFKR